MTDLTKITTPFGLLDKETQDALKAWPHGVECYEYSGWEAVHWPTWAGQLTYRALPVPQGPCEWWIPMFGEFPGPPFTTEAEAREYHPDAHRIIHVREVTDDAQHRMNVAAMLQSANAMIPAELEE